MTVPGVGHAVVGGDPSDCGIRQLRRWLAGGRVRARCPRVGTDVPRVTVPPASFRAVEPADGVTGSGGDLGVRRTVAALDATLADLGFAVSPGAFGGERGGGLRGGTHAARRPGPARRSRLVVVPGVRVTGRERRGGALRLGVTGATAARGRVAISARGRLTGRLGGRPVRATLENGPPQPFGLFSAGATRAVASVAVSTPVAARP